MVFDFDTMNNAWNGLAALSENCKSGQVGLCAATPESTNLVVPTGFSFSLNYQDTNQ